MNKNEADKYYSNLSDEDCSELDKIIFNVIDNYMLMETYYSGENFEPSVFQMFPESINVDTFNISKNILLYKLKETMKLNFKLLRELKDLKEEQGNASTDTK